MKMMSPGVTFQYQTPSGFWLGETELDCMGILLDGEWKRSRGLSMISASYLLCIMNAGEYLEDKKWVAEPEYYE